MSNDNSPESFAKQRRAVIVAPAGYGKTELIAQSVVCSEGRQLILTHTHSGVDSIRKRIKEKYPVSSSQYYIETIHSFALRFAGSYPKTTGLTIQQPQTTEDYFKIISSAIQLFDTKLGKDILKSSYYGIFVDEYQDCGIDQHELICKLAETLPCRIVGDPLQGIYDFGDNKIVDWDKHVKNFFKPLKSLTIPYRWKQKNLELAKRLEGVREKLILEQNIEFKITEKDTEPNIIGVLKKALKRTGRIYVICEPVNPNYPHHLAGLLKNRYFTIEPLTSNELCQYARDIENSQGEDKLIKSLNFAEKCLKRIKIECNEVFGSITKKRKKFRKKSKIELQQLYQDIISNDNLRHVYELFIFLENNYKPTYKRKQLWQEMKKGLHEFLLGETESLEEAVWDIRNQLRFKKNRIPKRCISRTVLLKGLECDHAIIIRPELFDKKNLYVALTRASSKVTIITNYKTWSNYNEQVI